jgi:hypothetical protein
MTSDLHRVLAIYASKMKMDRTTRDKSYSDQSLIKQSKIIRSTEKDKLKGI